MESPIYTNKEWLKDQYINQCKTIAQVAATAGCTHVTIQRWMRHYDIQSRRAGQRPETTGKRRATPKTVEETSHA